MIRRGGYSPSAPRRQRRQRGVGPLPAAHRNLFQRQGTRGTRLGAAGGSCRGARAHGRLAARAGVRRLRL